MDKGQHLRLLILPPEEKYVVALATDLSLNLQAQTENSTTKDSSDSNGNWDEFDVTGRSGEIQFSGLVGVGTDPYTPATTNPSAAEQIGGMKFGDWIDRVSDTAIAWKIVLASGDKNRVIGKTVCSGNGKLSNLQATAQNKQNATYQGTLTIYGGVTVGSD